ncbi:MocR-like pyridoxine biosynthesis transcription factor PdxR [Phaeacidiphilus oryzae]|uniref:MocR-like pyridoxine biosynthesis transcription factor PdxR n=1 Tax=Phaeacidiphilus oryzae TaxID=348818 RepID=UPI00055CA85F|nr:PLP-dependent aminotransferase family protein [Phaeacidiphilus oryzae]
MDSWANRELGFDLHLPGDRGTRAGLEDALRAAIREQRLSPGARLPSSRALAADLGLARNTVAGAYAQLTAEGWLTARQGSGTRVAEAEELSGSPVRLGGEPIPAVPATLGQAFPGRRPMPYDLRPGTPDLSLFPRERWLAAARRALSSASREALGYGDPRGLPAVRAALAEYLARVRGVRASPERIVVCAGYVQAAGLFARALAARGARRAGVEALGLPDIRETVARGGLAPVPLPVDEHGAQTAALLDADPDAALLTPAHQFPTGVALAPDRRTTAVSWARAADGYLLEDDYDGEFRYDRQPVGALQALAPDRVAYAGTASKSLTPGLRLGWLVVPPALLEPVVEEKRHADRQHGVLDQLTLADFLSSGDYDRQVRRARAHYRRRRDTLVSVLAPTGARITGIAAGLHAVVELPAAAPPLPDLVRAAAARGLGLEPLSSFGAAPETRALAVGYATPPEHAYRGALERLAAVLDGPRP